MASSSSSSWRYHVFPSFSGQDVRKSFLSHLLEALRRKSIDTFIDNSIERSLPIDPALLLAIKESRISIVIFSKNYASSTWCLNELVEIHKCFEELKQMVIPIFYDVVPSDVRKQTGKFGELFEETCEGKPEDHKQRWIQALRDVAKMAGYDLLTWPDEANLIESITNYVSNKLFTPSSDVGDFVGLDAHLERLSSMLCLESEESRMVGIVGPSGIGKSTIGRTLYSQHFSKFHHHAIVTYKRTIKDDYGMKLSWEQQFLSKILGQNDIKIDNLGEVEKRLKHKKVLIVLDDVDELELLKTLVGKTEWFGPGSRIIVITQNRQLLKAHEEIDYIYEVEFPSEGIALEMLCRYAFGKKSPPDGFRELAVEVAKLAGNLPLGLSILGSSLKGKGKDEWVEMLPRLRDDLDGRIEKTLRVSYDRLDKKDKELFLSIACFFKGMKVSVIKDFFGSVGLRMLADKFLIRITRKEDKFRILKKTPEETVEMHDLLQKLGIEIDREESERQPSRRRFLTNAEDIRDVLTDRNGTKSVLGISLEVTEPFSIDENSFKGMPNLQYIIVHHHIYYIHKGIRLDLPQGLSYLPRNLKLLKWDYYPAKCLPSNFNAKNLVKLRMKYSKLEKLWEGNQPVGSLKKMDMRDSYYLKEIPDLSNAINLEVLKLQKCGSLVTLPSSFQSLKSLVTLNLSYCTNLTEIPDLSNTINLEVLNLQECMSLVTLPSSFQSLESLVTLNLSYCTNLTEIPDLSNVMYEDFKLDIPRNLKLLTWNSYPAKFLPSNFKTEYLVKLKMTYSKLEKLWEGNQPLGSLKKMDMRYSEYLKEIPDLSNAINLEVLNLKGCKCLTEIPDLSNAINLKVLNLEGCKSLVTLPSSIQNVPTHLNLESLKYFNLKGCCQLRNFPQISMIMTNSFPQGIEISVEQEKNYLWNKNLRGPSYLNCFMKCIPSKFRPEHVVVLKVSKIMLKKLWEGVQSFESLVKLHLSYCRNLTEFPDLSKATNLEYLYIEHCNGLVRVPSTIGNLQKLKKFDMLNCIGLEVLPANVNLASLSWLDLSGCSRLRTFPQISKSIKRLFLFGTAIEEVPCCIDNFSRLTSLSMSSCESLKNICPNIFRLTRLQRADFSNSAMATMEGHFSCIPLYENIEKRYHVEKRSMSFFNFQNCSKLDGDARELILRSCFKFMVLPGGEVPTYFKHRASGNNLTITLPQSSLSQEFLRFQACIVVGSGIKHGDAILTVYLYFNDEYEYEYEYEYEVTDHCKLLLHLMGKMDLYHLVSCSFKFRPTVLPSKLDVSDVKFKFSSYMSIKGCGVQLLSVSPSPDISNGSSEREYNQQFGEKADVVETERSKKRMRMTSGTSEEYFNLPFGQTVADTELTALDPELSLGQEASYPCVEGEALITELQDAEIPIVDKSWKERAFKLSEPLNYPWGFMES